MSPKLIHATLLIQLEDNKKVISALAASLAPETMRGKRLTFTVSTRNSGRILVLGFSSTDFVSLRAAMNTILRLTASALKSICEVRDSDAEI